MKRVTVSLIMTAILMTGMISLPVAQEQPSVNAAPIDFRTATFTGDRVEIEVFEISDIPIWQSLIDLSSNEKANAEISLLLERDASEDALQLAKELTIAWNKGHFSEALTMFSGLEALTDVAEMSICTEWREPLSASAERWGSDVRIGDRDSVYCVDLEIDYATGNLFALLLLSDFGTQSRWTMNFSEDNGQTWTETYSWNATYHINDAAATVVADHCYVLFTRGVDQDQVLGYRFKLSDGLLGNFPGGTSYIIAFTTSSPEVVEEVDVVSNDDFDAYASRLYLAAITSNDNLRFYWDDETAESWSLVTTGITDAEQALSICVNVGYSDYLIFASYIDNGGFLKIDGVGNDEIWTNTFSQTVNTTSKNNTSIGAWQDTVHCFYEFLGMPGSYCRYQVSYNGGAVYLWGTVDDSTVYNECPSLCARRGGGVGVTYRHYASPRQLRYVWRDYAGWPWEIGPQQSTDHEPYYIPSAMQYLGGDVHGIVYACWNSPYKQAAYFVYGPGCCNTPGDANNDGSVNVGDAVYMINYVFKGGDPPECLSEGDANNDCALNVGDAVYLINYVFKGGAEPECGCVTR